MPALLSVLPQSIDLVLFVSLFHLITIKAPWWQSPGSDVLLSLQNLGELKAKGLMCQTLCSLPVKLPFSVISIYKPWVYLER